MITINHLPPAPEPKPMGNYRSVGKTIQQQGHTHEAMQATRMRDLTFMRECLLNEASNWTGDKCTAVWIALCGVSSAIGAPITREECHAAAQQAHPKAHL